MTRIVFAVAAKLFINKMLEAEVKKVAEQNAPAN